MLNAGMALGSLLGGLTGGWIHRVYRQGIAIVLAIGYLAYDVALSRGVALPGGDLRLLYLTVYVLLVLGIGSLVTYLIVPQPRGSSTEVQRSGWSAALGFFAAVPIAYLVMIVTVQIVRPLFG